MTLAVRWKSGLNLWTVCALPMLHLGICRIHAAQETTKGYLRVLATVACLSDTSLALKCLPGGRKSNIVRMQFDSEVKLKLRWETPAFCENLPWRARAQSREQ